MAESVKIIYTDGVDERFIALCRELDGYLYGLIGAEKQRCEYDRYNTLKDINDAALLLIDGETAACGSFKKIDASTAEIKRVFTNEGFRRRGCGKAIMKALEAKAKEKVI